MLANHRLVRHRILMDAVPGNAEDDGVKFAAADDAGDSESVFLSVRNWTDMGEPQQISVTVEPGNTLSD
jgi:hypothetical protein